MAERANYPLTSAKNSAERFALITLDHLVAAVKVMAAKLDADLSAVDVAAEATLNMTADIVLESAALSASRNDSTFMLEVLAAAPNEDDSVIVEFAGSADAIIARVTPNDGTNNSLTPVELTSAQLVELINDGSVVGVNVNLIDPLELRALQSASGGDATELADGGEGDDELATFSGGISSYSSMVAEIEDIRASLGIRLEDFRI